MKGVSNIGSVAVLGASGFLGRHVARIFASAGYRVIGCHRGNSDLSKLPGVDLWSASVYFDISDPIQSTLWDHNPCIIVNCAAYGVVAAEQDVGLALSVNATSLAQLLPLSDIRGVKRFIQVGSAVEYGSHGKPIEESCGMLPNGLYSQTKAAGSLIALVAAAPLAMSLCVVRPFGFYGPGENAAKFIPGLANALIAGRPIDLSSGRAVRDYTYVDDICMALLAVLSLPIDGFRGQIFNIASGRPISIRALGEGVIEALGADPALARWGSLPDRPGEAPFLVGCAKRVTDLTGWTAQTTLKVGITKTVKSLL